MLIFLSLRLLLAEIIQVNMNFVCKIWSNIFIDVDDFNQLTFISFILLGSKYAGFFHLNPINNTERAGRLALYLC